MAKEGRPVQRSKPSRILPIDRCPLRNESLGFCRPSIFTGNQKFLVDVQSAFQGRVSACGPAASAASYLCFGTRSRRAARAGGNAYISRLIEKAHPDAGKGRFLMLKAPSLCASLPLIRCDELFFRLDSDFDFAIVQRCALWTANNG